MRHNLGYRGDSPAKKITRLMFWLHVRHRLGVKKFLAGPYLVFPSREAGDVSVLLGLGVDIKNIIGVDWDPNEAALARGKFPGLKVHCEDVAKYVDRSSVPYFACAFLDFCSPSNTKDFARVAAVADSCVAHGGLLGCAFMVGREHGMRDSAMEYRRDVEQLISRMSTARKKEVEDLEAYFSRAFLIQNEIEKRAVDVPLQVDSRFFYSSKDGDGWHGHPWCCTLFWVDPLKKKKGEEPSCFYFESTKQDVSKQALEILKEGGRADLLLNLPKTSMAALKAHITRGTYK